MELTIGELAQRAGLNPSAIRYYKSVGIVPEPARVNGRRRYNSDMLYLLRAVGIAKQAGFSIDDMRQLFGGSETLAVSCDVWEPLARRKLAEVDALIQHARAMKALLEAGLSCGCLGPRECVVFGRVFDEVP